MRAYTVVGLQFGDEGKGTIVEYLARKHAADLVVRCSGGAQAQHNVVTSDGRHHTFSQFGSATLAGVPTSIGPEFVVDPLALLREASGLRAKGVRDPISLVEVDSTCLVTTPIHATANMEYDRTRNHGTTGRGIGMTRALAAIDAGLGIRFGELSELGVVIEKMERIAARLHLDADIEGIARSMCGAARPFATTSTADLLSRMQEADVVVLEGSQGVLLDQDYGFFPYVTYSRTDGRPAQDLLGKISPDSQTVVGVARTYTTRHGAGPMPTEDIGISHPETHNHGGAAGRFRVGALDLALLKYAADACPIDEIAVTHVDRLASRQTICTGYVPARSLWADKLFRRGCPRFKRSTSHLRQTQMASALFAARIETAEHDEAHVLPLMAAAVSAQISVISSGPTYEDKQTLP